VAARDPWGFRPLVIGKLEGATIVASETCALDLIDAEYVREVEPGELIVIDRNGLRSFHPFPPEPVRQCVFEHIYFARPDSEVFGHNVLGTRQRLGRQLAREAPRTRTWWCPCPTAGWARPSAIRRRAGSRSSGASSATTTSGARSSSPSSPIRSFGVKIKLNPVRSDPGGQARGAHRRLDRARHHLAQDRGHGARGGGARGAHAHQQPAHHGPVLLRHRHAAEDGADRVVALGRGDPQSIGADSLAYLSHEGLLAAVGDAAGQRHCTACFSGRYPVAVSQAEDWQLKLFEKVRA
jgi:amidophosphoribosyltransferase